jgi:hypothetical protein
MRVSIDDGRSRHAGCSRSRQEAADFRAVGQAETEALHDVVAIIFSDGSHEDQ